MALAAAVAFERDTFGTRPGRFELAEPDPADLAPRRPITGLVTVDHQLQDGSSAQAQRVAAIGYELGFDPVLVLPVEIEANDGPEADARSSRYAALDAVASAYRATIVLGHTRRSG